MSIVIRIEGGSQLQPTPWDGRYVSGEYVPEWGGFGKLPTTEDVDQARRWPTLEEAMEWQRQPHPNGRGGFREDGQPNRPLTWLTVTFERAFD